MEYSRHQNPEGQSGWPHVQNNLQEHGNPQMQQPGRPSAQWGPPPPRQPVRARAAARAPRGRQPYPAHLTRFPSELLPRGRRGRGHSIGFYLYFGRHWIAGLITLFIYLTSVAIVLSWIMLVVTGWAFWCAGISLAWLCGASFAPARRAVPARKRR